MARGDVASAARWYDNQRAGLGDEFLYRVQEAMSRIEHSPQAYAVVFEGLRRVGLRQFPYNLFFKILPDNSLVIACLHGKRSPLLARERASDIGPTN